MAPLRFIHTADLHLDSPFKGLTHIPDHLYEQIRNSTFQAFDRVIDYAIEQKVDFVLISGDVYDLEDRSIRAQIYFLRGLERLASQGIHTYIIHGNHDPVDQISTAFKWPETVHFFPSDRVEKIAHIKDGKEVAHIYGRSYPTKVFKENIVDNYQPEDSADVFKIGMLHSNVDANPMHDSYAPCSSQDLKAKDIDYWALGHVHKKQILSSSKPMILYPGNIQGRHIKESGYKGCYIIEADKGSINFMQYLPTSVIVWEELAIDVSDKETIHEVMDSLQENLNRLVDDIKSPVIVRVHLTGQTELHFELSKDDRVSEIQDILNESNTSQTSDQPWVWIESLSLKTGPKISLEEILNQDSFLSDFLYQHSHVLNNEQKKEMLDEVIEGLLRNRDLRKHLLPLSDDEIDEVYNEIINLALDHFVKEGIS